MASRKLEVVWVGDTKDFDKSVNKVGKAADTSGGKLGKLAGAAKVGAAGLGVALAGAAVKCVSAFMESEKVSAQTAAVLKSTGGAANVTADEVGNLASAISKKSGLDDEAVQSGENLLLTFTNIRNEAGKGNKVFDQASGLMADMSVALGQDMKSSAIQLGKALNDPIKGVTALQRVGVSFTAAQKDQIKTMVESGDRMGAQKLILGELRKEFGGSAKAAGDTFAGKMDKLKVAVGNVEEKIGGALVPALLWTMDTLTKVGNAVGGFVSSTWPKVKAFFTGGGVASSSFADSVKSNFESIKSSVVTIVGVVGPVVKHLFEFWLAVQKRVLPALVQEVKGAFEVIRGVVEVIAGLLTLDFGKAWDGVKHIFGGAVNVIVGAVRNITAPMREAVSRVMGAVVHGVATLGGNLYNAAADRVKAVVSGVRSILGDVAQAGKSVVLHVAQGLADAGTNLFDAAKSRVAGVVSGVRSILDDVLQAGKSIVSHVASGIADAGSNLYDAIRDRVKAVLSGARSIIGDVKGIGGDIVGALASGIRGAADAVHKAIRWVLDKLNDAIPNSVHIGPLHINLPDNPFAQGGVVGGYAAGGAVLARVGELGPENVLLPVGSRVTQASESTGAAGGGIHVEVNNYGDRMDEVTLAERIAFRVATT